MAPEQDAARILAELETVLRDRLAARPEGSYSLRLLTDRELVQRKVMEEAFEVCLELGRAQDATFSRQRVASEAADLLFHLLAGLVGAGVPLDDVLTELVRRRRSGRAGEDVQEG